MANRSNHIVMEDFPTLTPALAGLQQNQIAGHLGAIRKDFQEKLAADDLRRVEENSQSVEKMFGKDTQTDIIVLCNAQSIEGIADIWKKWAVTPKTQHLSPSKGFRQNKTGG